MSPAQLHLKLHGLLLVWSFILIEIGAQDFKDLQIETENLIHLDSLQDNGMELEWTPYRHCPWGTVVTAFKFVTLTSTTPGSLNGLTGVSLQCSRINYFNHFVPVKTIHQGMFNINAPWMYSSNYRQAVGFEFQKWRDSDSTVEISGQWRFTWDMEQNSLHFPLNSRGRVRAEFVCPESYAICGFQTLRHVLLDVIVRLRLTCCYHCVPEEYQNVIYDWTNNGVTDIQHTVTKKMGGRNGDSQTVGGKKDKTKSANSNGEGEINRMKSIMDGSTVGNTNGFTFSTIFPLLEEPISTLFPTIFPRPTLPPVLQVTTTPKAPRPPLPVTTVAPPVATSLAPVPTTVAPNPFDGSYDSIFRWWPFNLITKGASKPHEVVARRRASRQTVDAAGPNAAGPYPAGPNPSNSKVDYLSYRQSEDGGGEEGGDGGSGGPAPVAGTSAPAQGGTTTPKASGSGAGTSVGASQNGGSSASASNTNSDSLNLRAKFDQKFGAMKVKGFNWQDQSWVEFTQHYEETDTIVCKALHRCILKQLSGKCGEFRFDTPVFDFNNIPLRLPIPFDMASSGSGSNSDNSNGPGTGMEPGESEMVGEMERKDDNGENWILAKNISPRTRPGYWSEPHLCPPGSFVTGQEYKMRPYPGPGPRRPFMSLTGMNLVCSKLNSSEEFEPVTTLTEGIGIPMNLLNSSTPAIGFNQFKMKVNGQNFEMRFQKPTPPVAAPGLSIPSRPGQISTNCPDNFAVCGMQVMFDLNSDRINSMALKCCYSCTPKEKIIVLESFTNLGYTDTIQTVRRLVGVDTMTDKMAGGQNHTMASNNKDGLSATGLQAGFAARFDSNYEGGFNWADTSLKFWQHQEEKTLTILCRARHLCVYRQLFGVCGTIEIPTPYTLKESFNLDDPRSNSLSRDLSNIVASDGQLAPGIINLFLNKTKLEPTPFFFNSSSSPLPLSLDPIATTIPNLAGRKRDVEQEIWILAPNLTFSKGQERWVGPLSLCPVGTVVTGQSLRQTVGRRFHGIELQCSFLNDNDKFEHAGVLSSHQEKGEKFKFQWYDAQSPAIGFSFVQYNLNGTLWKGKWEMRFENEVEFHGVPLNAQNVLRYLVQCPPSRVICGLQSMLDGEGQVVSLTFKCCQFCRPEERQVILSAMSNHGSTPTSQNVAFSIGSQILGGDFKSSKFRSRSRMDSLVLQKMFSYRFKNSNSSNWNWGKTTLGLWSAKRGLSKKMETLECPPRHHCSVQQMVGVCGNFEIMTPFLTKEIISLGPPPAQPSIVTTKNEEPVINETLPLVNSSTIKESARTFKSVKDSAGAAHTETKIETNENGEIWILAGDLSSTNETGSWSDPNECPMGSVVTGEQFKTSDGLSITGLNLQCSVMNEWDEFQPVKILSSGNGKNSIQTTWYSSKTNAVGYTLVNYEIGGVVQNAHWEIKFGDRENQWGMNVKMEIPEGATNVVTIDKNCPTNFAICGVRTLYGRNGRGISVLHSIQFKCCYYCTPREDMMVLDSFINLGHSPQIQTVEWVIGTRHVDSGLYITTSGVHLSDEETPKKRGRKYEEFLQMVNPLWLKSIFAGKFKKLNSILDTFNWAHSLMSVQGKLDKKVSYSCEGRHVCSFKQLIGVCGVFQISTPHTVKEIIPLDI